MWNTKADILMNVLAVFCPYY